MSHRLISHLNRVSDEFDASRSALELTVRKWPDLHREDEVLGQALDAFRRSRDRIEATYVVRLFAEFEAILREQYPHSRPGRSVPERSAALIDGLRRRYRIPSEYCEPVHRVREYRHAIAHADAGAQVISFAHALSCLRLYLSRIPDADVP